MMDIDENYVDTPDLTAKVTIKNHVPVYFGAYSHVLKGFYHEEVVRPSIPRILPPIYPQVAIKVVKQTTNRPHAMQRVCE
jgi:hypothetical protein